MARPELLRETFVEMSDYEMAERPPWEIKAFAEQLFWERAGAAAVPIYFDGLLWLRDEYSDMFRACCYVPHPDGLLL